MGKKFAYIAIAALLFAALNALFFLWTSPSTRTTFAWVTYGFTAFAFFMGCLTTVLAKEDQEDFEFATGYLSLLGFRYFTLQFVVAAVGILLQVLNKITSLFSILFYTLFILLLLYYVIQIIVHIRANQATSDALALQRRQHEYVQKCSSAVAMLLPHIPADRKREVQALYDVLRCSPNQASAAGQQAEQEVTAGLAELSKLVKNKEWEDVSTLAAELIQKAKLRNGIL